MSESLRLERSWGRRIVKETTRHLWVCYERGPCCASEGVHCDHGASQSENHDSGDEDRR